MAAQCPVIVTPEVGLAKIIHDVGCGVVASGDPEIFGLEIRRLLADDERRRSMGDAGRRTVEARYSWNIIGAQILELYANIVANRDAALVEEKSRKKSYVGP
jgi:glycosyltransferase involved in cell wall biosynthesis